MARQWRIAQRRSLIFRDAQPIQTIATSGADAVEDAARAPLRLHLLIP